MPPLPGFIWFYVHWYNSFFLITIFSYVYWVYTLCGYLVDLILFIYFAHFDFSLIFEFWELLIYAFHGVLNLIVLLVFYFCFFIEKFSHSLLQLPLLQILPTHPPTQLHALLFLFRKQPGKQTNQHNNDEKEKEEEEEEGLRT